MKNTVISWSLCADGHEPCSRYILEAMPGERESPQEPEKIVISRPNGERAYPWSPRREDAVRKAYDRPRSAARLLYTSWWDDMETRRRYTIHDLTAADWQRWLEHPDGPAKLEELRRDGWRNVPAPEAT